MIELRDIWFSYPGAEVPALRGVSLRFDEGAVAVVGPNGAGKTTLLKVASALYRPSQGRVMIDGVDPWSLDEDGRTEVRRTCVYLHERPVMLRGTVWENVAYPLRVRGLGRDEVEERVERALKLMGIRGLAGRRASQLSAGQLQRVALARAIVVEPRHILLDEPTANLDSHGRALLENLLRRLASQGTSIIFSTHDRFSAQRVAGRVVLMEDGVVVAEGEPEEVLKL